MSRIIIWSEDTTLLPTDTLPEYLQVIKDLFPIYKSTKWLSERVINYRYIKQSDNPLVDPQNLDLIALYHSNPKWLPRLIPLSKNTLDYLTQLNIPYIANSDSEISVIADVSHIPFSPRESIKHRIRKSKLKVIIKIDGKVPNYAAI
jgi:hypothetical protein